MLFLVFYYLLAAILIFQGLHFYGEQTQPLGTVPEEVTQSRPVSERWGGYLMGYGALMVACGLASHWYSFFPPALGAIRAMGVLSLILFGAWVIFKGRTIEYLGAPAEDDHAHAHH